MDDPSIIDVELLAPYHGVGPTDIEIVSEESDVDAVRAALMCADAVGFDSESNPFPKERGTSAGPHLIQLATDTRAYLFPIETCAHIGIAMEVLASESIVKVGFGLGGDRKLLKKRGIEMVQMRDLCESLRDRSGNPLGAQRCVAFLLGQKLDKASHVRVSNWALPKLSDRQIFYAANDAMAALQSYREWTLRLANGAITEVMSGCNVIGLPRRRHRRRRRFEGPKVTSRRFRRRQYLATLKHGEELTGVVKMHCSRDGVETGALIGITGTEFDGFVPCSEMSFDATVSVVQALPLGSTITASVSKVDAEKEHLRLSTKQYTAPKAMAA